MWRPQWHRAGRPHGDDPDECASHQCSDHAQTTVTPTEGQGPQFLFARVFERQSTYIITIDDSTFVWP